MSHMIGFPFILKGLRTGLLCWCLQRVFVFQFGGATPQHPSVGSVSTHIVNCLEILESLFSAELCFYICIHFHSWTKYIVHCRYKLCVRVHVFEPPVAFCKYMQLYYNLTGTYMYMYMYVCMLFVVQYPMCTLRFWVVVMVTALYHIHVPIHLASD